MTRDFALSVRFEEQERRALDEIAKAEDVSAATIVRRAVRREIERVRSEAKKGRAIK